MKAAAEFCSALPRRLIALRRLAALICLTALYGLTLLFAPTGAGANTYEFFPCGTLGGAVWGAGDGSASDWPVTSECPYRIVYAPSRPLSYGRVTWWSFPDRPRPGLTIDAARFVISGGDGSEHGLTQGVRICSPSACGRLLTNSAGTTGPQAFSVSASAGDFPLDATQLRLEAACGNDSNCVDPGAGIVLTDTSVTFRDDSAPVLRLIDPDPDRLTVQPLSPPPAPFVANAWNSGIRSVWLEAEDSESGVFFVDGELSGPFEGLDFDCGNPWSNWPFVAVVYVQACPDFDFNYFTVNTRDHRPGASTLRIVLHDLAGNTDVKEIPVKIDNIPPPSPTGLRLRGDPSKFWRNEPAVGIEWSNTGESLETATQSGIFQAGYDVDPMTPGPANPLASVAPGSGISSIDPIVLNADGVWKISTWVQDRAGFRSAKADVTVGLDRAVLGPITIGPSDWVSALPDGGDVTFHWQRPANATAAISGICGYALSVDRLIGGDSGTAIKIHGDVTQAFLPSLPEGRSYVHMRAVSCSGVPGEASHLAVDADRIAPTVDVAGASPGGWIDENQPLRLHATDAGSGVAQLTYRVDGGPGQTVEGDTVEVVLAEGAHSVSFYAVDLAGNKSDDESLGMRVDSMPPIGSFDPPDSSRPTRVSATVVDAGIGVAKAWLEYRPIGESSWQPFGAPATPAPGEDRAVDLVARFPDATVIAGVYRLRVVGYDRLGHPLSSDVRIDGSAAVITAPARATAGLSAGFPVTDPAVKRACAKARRTSRLCKRAKARAISITARRIVAFGASAELRGTLTNPHGDGVAEGQIDVFSVGLDGVRRRLGQIETDEQGGFGFIVPAGPSRRIVVRFGGDETLLAREIVVRLLTIGKVSLTGPRLARTGGILSLKGRVHTGAGGVSALGRPVQVEYKSTRSWFTLCGAKAVEDGAFDVACSLPKVTRPVRLRLRATVEAAPGWPFEAGHSRTIIVVIRP